MKKKFKVVWQEVTEWNFVVEAETPEEAEKRLEAIIAVQGGVLCGHSHDNFDSGVNRECTEPAGKKDTVYDTDDIEDEIQEELQNG